MKLRPIHANIIIKHNDLEKQTAGGLYIASTKADGVVEAKVLAAGPGTYNNKGKFITPDVEPGDRILVNVNGGTKFKFDDEELVTITNSEIVAVLS